MWLDKSFRLAVLLVVASNVSADSKAETTAATEINSQQLTLNQIMADPDWMGNSPLNPIWSLDESSIFYNQKAIGHRHLEDYRIQLGTLDNQKLSTKDSLFRASQQAHLNQDKTRGTFVFQGDVYWINLSNSEINRLTADEVAQSNARFVSADTLSYFQGHQIFLHDLNKGYAEQIADFKTKADPENKKPENYLEQSQPRLLTYIKNTQQEDKFQKDRKQSRSLSSNKTWYLGGKVDIRTFRLSPDAKWLVLGITDKKLAGKADHMPEFVTADGYVKDRKVRPLVGSSSPTNESFFLIDLVNQQKYALDTTSLPGINDDPLDSLKKSAAQKLGHKYKEQQGSRAIYAYNWTSNGGVEWSDDSNKIALLLFSEDNKDRWIVGLDVDKKKLKTLHWMSDDAWVNDWTFNEFGWLPDNETLYYLSEEDGYSHLYIKKGKRRARQLTHGEFEVSNITVADSGEQIYFKANRPHPGIYEIYRVSIKGGDLETLTQMGGVNDYQLSPSETQLLIRHSELTRLPELYLVAIGEDKPVQRLTNTASDKFTAIDWQKPAIVEVPSSNIKRSIFSRFYQAQSDQKSDPQKKKPAVIFVHGAGYLQNSHQGWSGYFREYMFHNLLTEQGYVVLDMDYRASKGYGRDWRTAIYQNMGTPELEDLKDGVQWLVDNADVDPARVGVYGGSYGGFMTFMALFKEPELFAAGAALRPVTDWVHYNHGYTSNILNTPQVDPDAFERSSPIEFAEGLNKPLLIAHGMVDDNVFFKDSVRLVQRLIELEKSEYFETAIYPVEPHGFKQPSSWLDEYTRIYKLFERHLN